MDESKAALSDILESALLRLESQAGASFAQQVSVVWNKRMRSTAGRAFWPECRVELNPKLVAISFEEVRRTLLHELAHLLAYQRCGRRRIAPHGAEWQQACADLGIPGESARHTLPLPSNTQKKKWRYRCPHCEQSIERVRQMKRHVACYSCCQKFHKGRYHKRFELIAEMIEQ
jgi:predicted SprT family Zn-dependent metalloprotease